MFVKATPKITMNGSSYQSGISLIEVLIAMLIFSVGMLGIAVLQTTGVRLNHDTELKTQASYLASSMVDRMRANQAGVDAGDYGNVTGSETDPGCISSGCTAKKLAQYDAYFWNQEIDQYLPAATGKVELIGNIHRVTISWTESADSLNTGGAQQYVLEVKL